MKRKIFTAALAAAMVAILVTGASLAYFSDKTEKKSNVFTVGNVNIELDEPEWDKATDHKIVPGRTIVKDPTIAVVDGSEDAYVKAEIIINDADTKVIPTLTALGRVHTDWVEGETLYDVSGLLSGGILGDATDCTWTSETWGTGENTLAIKGFQNDDFVITSMLNNGGDLVFNVYFKNAYAAKATIALFENINIPEELNNAQVEALNDLTIDITAYAIQAEGFTGYEEAFVNLK